MEMNASLIAERHVSILAPPFAHGECDVAGQQLAVEKQYIMSSWTRDGVTGPS